MPHNHNIPSKKCNIEQYKIYAAHKKCHYINAQIGFK